MPPTEPPTFRPQDFTSRSTGTEGEVVIVFEESVSTPLLVSVAVVAVVLIVYTWRWRS